MGKCLVCREKATTISDGLGVCLKCIREKPEQALEITGRVHAKSRARFGLPSVRLGMLVACLVGFVLTIA